MHTTGPSHEGQTDVTDVGTRENPIIIEGSDDAAQERAAELSRTTGRYHGVVDRLGYLITCGDPPASTAYEPVEDDQGRQVLVMSADQLALVKPGFRAARALQRNVFAERATAQRLRRCARTPRRARTRAARRRECRSRSRRTTTSREDGPSGPGEPPPARCRRSVWLYGFGLNHPEIGGHA